MLFQPKSVTFTDLPQDILLEMSSYLSPEHALTLGNVNKFTHTALQHELFWQKKFLMHFPDFYHEMGLDSDTTWKTKFQTTYLRVYKRLSAFDRKIFSSVKENDVNALQKINKPYQYYSNMVDNRNVSPLCWAQRLGHQLILDYFYQLESHQPGVDKIQWAIACHQPSAQIVLRHELFNDSQAQGKFIHLAASTGNISLLEELLTKQPSLLEERNNSGCTPLLLAVRHGHTNLVRYLLAHGADVEAEYGAGTTSLTMAISTGHNQIVTLLLQARAKLIPTLFINQYCPIHIAAFTGNVFALQRLLALRPDLLELPTSQGFTPLITATLSNSVTAVEYLLSQGANVEASSKASLWENTSGRTALCFAVSNGNLPLVDLLLAAGAQTTVKTAPPEFQPLHLAISRGKLSVVQKLIGHSPALCTIKNAAGATPIQFAASNYQFAIVEYLLQASHKKQALNKLPDFKLTPKKQTSQLSKYRDTQNPAYYDLEQYITNKNHHFHSPLTFFGAIANKLSTSTQKLAAAKALKSVVTDQKDPAELIKHSKQFKHGKLGDIYHRIRKL